MEDVAQTTNGAQFAEEPKSTSIEKPIQLPRPGISFLFLWTTCCAVQMAASRSALEEFARHDNARSLQFWMIVFCIKGSLDTSGTIVLLYRHLRFGDRMLTHPGHWIMAISSISLTTEMAAMELWYVGFPVIARGIQFLGFWLICPLCYLYAARITQSGWRLVYIYFAVVGLLVFVPWLGIIAIQNVILPIVVALAIWALTIIDWRSGTRRDWLHWAGIVYFLMLPLIQGVVWFTR